MTLQLCMITCHLHAWHHTGGHKHTYLDGDSSADFYLHNEQWMTTLHQSFVSSLALGVIWVNYHQISLETLKFITLAEGSCQSVVILGQFLMKWRVSSPVTETCSGALRETSGSLV